MSNELLVTSLGLKPKKTLSTALKSIKGIEPMDRVLIVLLDGSGSMLDHLDNSRKIDVAWIALRTELLPNLQGWNYGVLIFQGNEAFWEVYPRNDVSGLLRAKQPIPIGGTPIMRALETAWGWSKANVKQARFILMSDGEPTDYYKTEILDAVSKHVDIVIDCVGIGEIDGTYDQDFLKEIARLTGGIFCEAKSTKLLANTILRLSPVNRPLLGTVKK